MTFGQLCLSGHLFLKVLLLFYLPILSQAYPHLPTASATIITHKLDCSNNGLKNQQQHKLLGISKYTWRTQYNKCRYPLISISNYQLLGKPVPATPPAWQIILEPPAHTVTLVCNIHSCIYIHTHASTRVNKHTAHCLAGLPVPSGPSPGHSAHYQHRPFLGTNMILLSP